MKYHILLRITHWLMSACILGLIAIGWYMTGLTPEEGKYDFYNWHKTFGVLIIILFPIRVLLRKFTTVPDLPAGIKPAEQKLSHLVHIGLYILMISVPVIGYLFSSSGGHDVPFFNWVVPNVVGENEWLYEITSQAHWISAYALLTLVVLHVAGALKHRFFEAKENDVLRRML